MAEYSPEIKSYYPTGQQAIHRLYRLEYLLGMSCCCISFFSTYLGILLTSTMSFSSNMTSKASRMLNLLRQNLSKCSKDIKTIAYLSLVRPILEYSSVVWDPHSTTDVLYIEKIVALFNG